MPWWSKHLWVIAMQVVAFAPYCIGSRAFFKGRKHFMLWLAFGIVLDCIMAITASSGLLPRMNSNEGAPWASILFILHITLSGGGMFAFILMFLYVLVRGIGREYPRLRRIQYRIFLPAWVVGVSIALVNFMSKVFFNVRAYDLPWQLLR